MLRAFLWNCACGGDAGAPWDEDSCLTKYEKQGWAWAGCGEVEKPQSLQAHGPPISHGGHS